MDAVHAAVLIHSDVVDQPQVDDVDGNLGIVDFLQRFFDLIYGYVCWHRFAPEP